MTIKEISIRNFKSFGNAEQILKLNTEKGELVLLSGRNGSGKSTTLEIFEYCLYGKVKSKTKKKVTLSNLPNKINSNLLTKIKFNAKDTDIEVVRGMNPNTLELWENGVIKERAGKANIDGIIENYIGIDLETFKSFISMSVNDFKNFISLTNDEKQLLLDKLFNLEVINTLNNVLKELVKTNKQQVIKHESEITTLNDSITSIQQAIEKSIQKDKEDKKTEINFLKEKFEEQKINYNLLKEKIDKIKIKDIELKKEYEKEREQLNNFNNELRNVEKDINLYNSGKCPTCATDFNNDHFFNLKDLLIEKKNKIELFKKEVETTILSVRSKQEKLQTMSDSVNKSFNDLTYQLRNYKTQIDRLIIEDKNNEPDNKNIVEFENTIVDLKNKKTKAQDKHSSGKEKELYYKELTKIFSEDGVKKTIIAGIIKPINHFISENIRKMDLSFQVKLDETFTATITQLNSNYEHEELSTGETRRINIAILIAYLKLIRTKKYINILFLDEIFSSIDSEGIESILNLLKSFASEYKINIFVVHHALMNQDLFDRVIKINKNVFSYLTEETNFNI